MQSNRRLEKALNQEKMFHKNRWEYSKSVVKGTFGKENLLPEFTKEEADNFYPKSYSVPKDLDYEKIHWFPFISANPTNEDFKPFDMSVIRPRDVKNVLKNANQKSSPGPDGIPYGILTKLPCTHHILASLFNKVLMYGAPPTSWSESIINLIHKKSSTKDPRNFRMIALSNTLGKVFHLLLSKRTTTFLTENKLIDPSIQKAFLPGISGFTEHNAVMDEIIQDVRKSSVRTVSS